MYRFRDTLPIDISRKTISGDLVTIDNSEEMGVVDSLEVSLEPIQGGSGDPSPSNVRPISGRTEVVTSRCGENFLNPTLANDTSAGVTATKNSDNSYTLSGTATGIAVNVWIQGNYLTNVNQLPSYKLKFFKKGTVITFKDCKLFFYNNETGALNQNYGFLSVPIGSSARTLTLPYDSWLTGVRVPDGVVSESYDGVTIYPQLELGTTATTYEPYQGTTYTTALGRTVYGGTLDVTSGVLTVTHATRTFDGTEDWRNPDSSGICWLRDDTLKKTSNYEGTIIASTMPTARTRLRLRKDFECGISGYEASGADNYWYIKAPNQTTQTATALKAWLQANNVQACYELATPQTYQLTPQQVTLLLGENHVWSDGEISVVWHKDLTKGRILPTEAVSINGQYIENVLDGYRTLYTKGRESLGAELNTYSVGTADGEKFKNKRYPARTITVGFQLIGENPQDFRQRFNNLNNLLAIEEADFIFNDEQDKFFSGYPVMDASVEAGRNNVTGEWKIYCAYPFKRSINTVTLSSDDESGVVLGDNSATFTFNYDGVIPSKPLLRCEFASAKSGGDYNEDGDCGFVAFLNSDESIIQLGNPEVIDVDALNKNGTLINSEFDALTGWTASGLSVSSITDQYWNSGAGQTQDYAMGAGTLSRSTTGAIGFEFDVVQRLCVSAPTQTGAFKASLKNDNKVVVGYEIVKTGSGTNATVNYILNDTVVGTDSIDISYYNTNFGYCNRTPVYVTETYQTAVVTYVKKKKKKKKKKTTWVTNTRQVQTGWNYTQSNLNSGISRDGGVVTFSIGELPDRTFKNSDIENTAVYDVVFETSGDFHTDAIRSCAFIAKAGVPFAEIPNVFTAGDVIEADCSDANVYLYRDGSLIGHLEPQYGALGNDWEDFDIKVGQNIIRAVWSDWVNTSYKPTIKIIFNKVYI